MVRKIILITLSLIVTVLVFGYLQFANKINREIEQLFSKTNWNNKIVTEKMLEGLPSPVQKYLHYSGVVNKPWVNTVNLKQTGQMKSNSQGKWFPIVAEEYYSVDPPGFIWRVRSPKKWLPIIHGRDEYRNNKGQLFIKLLSLFSVVKVKGEEIDQGAMMRYLNEMMWFPTAFLGKNISWKAIDENSAEVILTNKDKSVSAIMYFDDQGKLVNFVAKRYMSKNTDFFLETWETPISEYGEFNGFKLPIKGSAIWKLKNDDYEYINISITEIKYN